MEGVEKTTLNEIKLDIELLKQLIEGNKKFLPVFVDPSTTGKSPAKGKASKGGASSADTGLVMFQGSLVDIGNLQASLEKSSAARVDTETTLSKLRADHTALEKAAEKLKEKLASVTSQLEKTTGELSGTVEHMDQVNKTNKELLRVVEDIHRRTASIVAKHEKKEQKKKEPEKVEKEEKEEPKEEESEVNGEEEGEEENGEGEEEEVEVKEEVETEEEEAEPMEDE